MTTNNLQTTLIRWVLALAGLAIGVTASAENFPTKPLKLVVGFPPGGGVDIVARLLGTELQKTLGQPVLVENRAGAGGSVAAEFVAKSAGDGYTLLMGNTGSLTINPSLYDKIRYDVQRDFAPVALVSTSPLIIVVNPSLPVKTLSDFIALTKKRPNEISFGTGGNGSIAHLTVELLKARSDITMVHVPYKGGSPAVADLIADHVHMVVEGVPLVAPFVNHKKLRALAVTSDARSPSLPDVPTIVEAGFPDLVSTAWYGVVVPATTPPEIVAALNKAINTVIASPSFRTSLTSQGGDPAGGTPAQFNDFLKKELLRWSRAVKSSGAKVE